MNARDDDLCAVGRYALQRRVMLGLGLGAALLAGGCAARAPLARLSRVALLPVRPVERYSIDERDILTKTPPPSVAALGAGAPVAVELFQRGQAQSFHDAVAALNPGFAESFKAEVARKLAGRGITVVELTDIAAAERARKQRQIATLSNDSDAFIDLTLSALGYRASFASRAYTPEVYVEFDLVAKSGRSFDGALYSYDIRAPAGDLRQVQAPASQLIAKPDDLIRSAPAVVENLRFGLSKIADLVVDDIVALTRGQALAA
jgi:hypothetical protein